MTERFNQKKIEEKETIDEVFKQELNKTISFNNKMLVGITHSNDMEDDELNKQRDC